MKFEELMRPKIGQLKCNFEERPLNREWVTRSYYCAKCSKVHAYSVVGKTGLGKVDAYTLGWKQKKDEMRRKHYKDLIQPNKDGRPNPEFKKAYGKYPHEK
ncbi:MAG: hypothetical protein UT24_C0016G0016 [Candidatus Woesebacteria bacterium GW2011_GWB1_39_12]|uniref:Uncharacterized protein n=1 Tax=Candidatus Woesebacteria bacterium GW2011_GWB1_39_12 TaxID=1618574 RepID=A0A0G0QEK2_9BACT|nr:MAG: hypothetical protein UT24_C0016G0016 [Candidatus Woesebacteria bacterium GW2011_GWB1_39_12]